MPWPPSSCCWLRMAAARASASCVVMVLKDAVRMPSSSWLRTGWRWLKSPCATARVPAASKTSGADSRSLNTIASTSADSNASSSDKRERQPVQALQAAARQGQFLVVPVDRLHRFGVARQAVGGTGCTSCSSASSPDSRLTGTTTRKRSALSSTDSIAR